ncbi:MAG: M28 family peptidase [Nitrospiraceae bacterium]|nr:M28 family peptidase [Nitrospiraceae bacterium]
MDLPSYLRLVVTRLAREIGVRTFRDLDRMERTAQYLEDEFRAAGCTVSRHPFSYDGATLHNIIAEIPGSDPGKILVIGAHYDTVRTTPGADDNASGIAGLLGLARLLKDERPACTVRLVAFAFEEPPAFRTKQMGSYHYARSLKDRRERVLGMICLEMIGFFSDRPGSQHYPLPFMKLRFPSTGNYIAMVGSRQAKQFTEEIAARFRSATDLPLVTLNAPAFVVGIDFSDHWAFNKLGYPAFMVTDTAFYRNANYHSPADLPETLDYLRMAKVIEGLAAAVRSLEHE